MFGSAYSTLVTSALMGIALFAPFASPMALYFEKVPVKTSSEATCLRFAKDVARDQAFTNVHSSGAEVAGEHGGAYVAITCVGRGSQPAIAVVMSVAPDFAVARTVGRAAAAKIRTITCIDAPC